MPHRKISRGPPELINIISEIAKVCSFKPFDYTLEFSCEDVDCFFDGMYKVTIKGIRDGQILKKVFIIKWHSDANKRAAFREAYRREYVFYRQIVPKILELQSAFNIIEGLKIKFPNCIYASVEWDKEAIVMTVPQRDGYRTHNRFHKLNLDHVSLTMKNLAKLHALSFVLERYMPEEFEDIKKSCYTDVQYSDAERMSKSMISYYNASVNVIKDLEAKKNLEQCAPYILNILNKCAMPNTAYRTICHGDCWNNNIYFKYRNNKPVELLFTDHQLVRYASPVTDISYYLYMSTDQEFRRRYYDKVITLYYATVSAVLRQCNLDIKDVYPEIAFRQHLKTYSVYGLIEALISMKIITAVPEDALKMKYTLCEDVLRDDDLQNIDLYVERVNGVVNDFFAANYSLDSVLS